jgi:hypothetical protein
VTAVVLRAIPSWVPGASHGQLHLEWDGISSPYFGHCDVRGLRMRYQGPDDVQLEVRAAHATADASLLTLPGHHLKLQHVRASDVTLRMVRRVTPQQARRHPRRVDAFAKIDAPGFSPVRQPTPPLSRKQIDRLWSVELDDARASLREVWLDEYRYVGPATLRGGMFLAPRRRVAVSPTTVQLLGGAVTAGPYRVATRVESVVEASAQPTPNPDREPLRIVRGLSAHVRGTLRVESLQALRLYRTKPKLDGAGAADVDLRIEEGRIASDSHASLDLSRFEATLGRFTYGGKAHVALERREKRKGLELTSALNGTVITPRLNDAPLVVSVRDMIAHIEFTSCDLAGRPRFSRIEARMPGLYAADTGPLTRQAARKKPLLAPLVLGQGPLRAAVGIEVTPGRAFAHLDDLSLGKLRFRGAALRTDGQWKGAAAGWVGGLAVGVKLDDSGLDYDLFIKRDWLPRELQKDGIVAPATEQKPAARVLVGRHRHV